MSKKKKSKTYTVRIRKIGLLEFIARLVIIIILSSLMYFYIWKYSSFDTEEFVWYFHQFTTGFIQCLILLFGFNSFRKVR